MTTISEDILAEARSTNRLLELILEHLRTVDTRNQQISPEALCLKKSTEKMKRDIAAAAEAKTCVVKTDGPYPFLNPLRILSLDIAELKKEVAESTWDHLAVKLLRLIEIVEQLEKRPAQPSPFIPLTVPFPPTAYPPLPTIPVIHPSWPPPWLVPYAGDPPGWQGSGTVCSVDPNTLQTTQTSVPDASGTSESPDDYGSPF